MTARRPPCLGGPGVCWPGGACWCTRHGAEPPPADNEPEPQPPTRSIHDVPTGGLL